MPTKHCVVFFADLADSVALYERLGDAAARGHVLALQRLLGEQLEAFGGVLHQIVGDELMVCFDYPDRALACATVLHRCAMQYSQREAVWMQLRIGLHYGDIIEDTDENRLFGDTVNLASRVNGIAQGGQTILTEAVLDHAPPAWQGSVRPFDVTTVKGKAEPVQVYDLPWQTDDLTAIVSDNAPGSAAQPVRKQRLVLSYRDAETDLSDLDAPFSIGRAITNNLIVHADSASRRHVTVARARDQFVLSDKSTNGTHVTTDAGETLYLRRQEWPITGSGVIALGAPGDAGDSHVVAFRCEALQGAPVPG